MALQGKQRRMLFSTSKQQAARSNRAWITKIASVFAKFSSNDAVWQDAEALLLFEYFALYAFNDFRLLLDGI